MAHHVAVFAENKPGKIEKVSRVLMEAGINIRAMTIGSSDKFGIIKLLVDKPDAAYEALKAAGLSAFRKEIVAVLMDDRPGGLNAVAHILGEAGLNIKDAYGFVIEDRKRAVLVVEVDQMQEAARLLAGRGLKTLSDDEIYGL